MMVYNRKKKQTKEYGLLKRSCVCFHGSIADPDSPEICQCLGNHQHTHQRDGIGKQYHRDIKSETEQYGQPHIFEGTVMVLTGALIEENDDENPHDGERDVSVNSP